MLETLVVRWGYLAVVVGTLLEGEAILLVAGALAHRGLLELPWVALAAFVGSVTGDEVWFHVGRRLGTSAIARRPQWARRAAVLAPFVERYGSLFVLGFRFLYGLRIVSPVWLGANRYPAARFAALNAIGGAIWTAAFTTAGWMLAASLDKALGRASRIEEIAAGALSAALLLAWAVRRVRAKRVDVA